MSGNFFSKFDSEYFSLIIFLKYLLILLLMLIFVTKMTLLEKNKICRTFRAVGHLGTLQPSGFSRKRKNQNRLGSVRSHKVSFSRQRTNTQREYSRTF